MTTIQVREEVWLKSEPERGDWIIEATRSARSSLGYATGPLRNGRGMIWCFGDRGQAELEALDLTMSRGSNLFYEVRRF